MSDMAASVPLVVDVDGTLIKSDMLHEATAQFVAHHPLETWRIPLWLMRGKQVLKCALAERVELDVERLPLRDEVLAYIRTAQAEGRKIYLASASQTGLVQRLADAIGGIAGVFGSDEKTNLSGTRKAERLNAEFGAGGYDYIGDRKVDFGVWSSARQVLAVSHSGGFTRRLRREYPDALVLAEPRVRYTTVLRAMRPHQWAKNVLLFLALVAGHHLDLITILATLIAFAAFCLAASSAYILNDMLDLPGDRAHTSKCRRPIAAGDLPIAHGAVLAPILMLLAIGAAMILPGPFLYVLLGYVALTLAYSLFFKRKLLVDVIVLAALYVIRVLGGIAAAGDSPSQWLLMFSLFLFLCLATVKRCSELVAARAAGTDISPGRSYCSTDITALFPLAAASGYGAVLVFALYMSSPEVMVLYSHPQRMWLICPLLLYWISRVLILSNRDEMHEDPVVFALSDRVSWLTAFLSTAIIAFSV